MKIRTTVLAFAALLIGASTFMVGCTTEDTVGGGTDTRTKLTSSTSAVKMTVTGLTTNQLYAFSVSNGGYTTKIKGVAANDAASINVFWTRDPLDNGVDTVFYEAVSAPSTAANTITWATAAKTSSLSLYESADLTPGHNSGLVLGTTSTTASIAGTSGLGVDLILATDNTIPLPQIELRSPDAQLTGARTTYFSNGAYMVGGGASNNFFTTDITNQIDTASPVNFYDIPAKGAAGSDSSAIILVSAQGHFARIEIVRDTLTGKLWRDTGGASSKRYIVVNVFYQPTTGWGYVSRPISNHGGNTLAPLMPITNTILQ